MALMSIMKIETENFPETPICVYETAQDNIPEYQKTSAQLCEKPNNESQN
jgi:hypothetical protein